MQCLFGIPATLAACETLASMPGFALKIQKVLETFDDQVTFIKKQYVKTIEKRDDFLDVGFLLTDYASDFYDGKQLTLCVYI